MKKILATTLGVLLATAAVSAFADKVDRENLAQCKTDIKTHFGEGTRSRLRSIKRTDGEAHMRLMVKPGGGKNRLIVCSVSGDSSAVLTDKEGLSLVAPSGEATVTMRPRP